MPTIFIVREPISTVEPTGLRIVLDTATSSGADGARPSLSTGMPGPRSGAPNTLTLRAEPRSGMVALP